MKYKTIEEKFDEYFMRQQNVIYKRVSVNKSHRNHWIAITLATWQNIVPMMKCMMK